MRPELLPLIPTVGVDAIPEDMPSVETKQAPIVEGIGQPTTACFFTRQGVDPTGWYLKLSSLPLSSIFLDSSNFVGGSSRSMMVCEDFGTQKRRHSILRMETNSTFLRR